VTSRQEARVPLSQIPVQRPAEATVAVVGNPNAGKSTLFNRLTGLAQRIGNYPGVTVERHVGILKADDRTIELIDLPGTHALSAHSFEEQIAVDVIFGRMPGTPRPDGILAVVDATNLYQGLYLVQQLLGLGCPVVIALTMIDAAEAGGIEIDIDALSARLGGVPVCPVVATTGQGMDALRVAVAAMPGSPPHAVETAWPELAEAAERIVHASGGAVSLAEAERVLVDGTDRASPAFRDQLGSDARDLVDAERQALFGSEPPLAVEARVRYGHVLNVLNEVQHQVPAVLQWHRHITNWLNRPWPGTIGLFVVMAIVFQAVFAWATPLMDLIDAASAGLSAAAAAALGDGWLASLVADGVIAGVGSVVIFLPQIVILFLFIILLEDSGYLARAAYLMDRAMRSVGLSGQSIIPMISSFACAVPGIMATRVIPNRRDRIATILAAPFMTCSARLPVYALLIAAFIPERPLLGPLLGTRAATLLGLYALGALAAIVTAFVLKRTLLRGTPSSFLMELPPYRLPSPRSLFIRLRERTGVFLKRAGTIILGVTIVLWALTQVPGTPDGPPPLEQSALGKAGQVIEPIIEPLGYDWKIGVGIVSSLAAREVIVGTLGTIYGVEDTSETSPGLQERLRQDLDFGSAIGLLIFFVFALQCMSTVAVMRRETAGWRWPALQFGYMLGLAYVGAWAANALL